MNKSEFQWKDDNGNLIIIEYSYEYDDEYTVEPTGAYMNILGSAVQDTEIIVDLDINDFDTIYLQEIIEKKLNNQTPYEDR